MDDDASSLENRIAKTYTMLNIWELITAGAAFYPVEHRRARISEHLKQLEVSGPYGQELSIEGREGGWLIIVHNVFHDGDATIFIPKKLSDPIMVDDNRSIGEVRRFNLSEASKDAS